MPQNAAPAELHSPKPLESVDLEDGPARYAGYASRFASFVRTGAQTAAVKVSSVRHLAYGTLSTRRLTHELTHLSFRRWRGIPAYCPCLGCKCHLCVRCSPLEALEQQLTATTDAVAVGYVAADVVSQTSKASSAGLTGSALQRIGVQTFSFQMLASILAPFLVIHTVVDASKKLLKNSPALRCALEELGRNLSPVLCGVTSPQIRAQRCWPRADSVPADGGRARRRPSRGCV
jgi:hypothetical protein